MDVRKQSKMREEGGGVCVRGCVQKGRGRRQKKIKAKTKKHQNYLFCSWNDNNQSRTKNSTQSFIIRRTEQTDRQLFYLLKFHCIQIFKTVLIFKTAVCQYKGDCGGGRPSLFLLHVYVCNIYSFFVETMKELLHSSNNKSEVK